MLPQNGQLDNPLFEIFYRKVCGDALHHEEVPETTRRAGICRGSTAAFRLCNGAKFVYNEENEKLAPRTGRRRSRKRSGEGGTSRRRRSKPQVRCGDAGKQGEGGTSGRRKSKLQTGCGDAGEQGESGTSARWESKARAERRRGRKARRGRDAGAAESKPQAGCGDGRKESPGTR